MVALKPFDIPFTAFHNYILDNIMPKLSGSGWKVLCVAIRQTLGWKDESTESGRKESDIISYSQFGKKTGIKSSSTISKAIQECLGNDYLVRSQVGIHPGTRKPIYSYHLNKEYRVASPKNEVEQIASPKNGVEQGVTSPENEVAASPKNGLTKERERNYSKETISPISDEISGFDKDGAPIDIPRPKKRYVHDYEYEHEDGTIETIEDDSWKQPQKQIDYQALGACGRESFHTEKEYNKLRKIEAMLESGKLSEEFWRNRMVAAEKHHWSFPELLRCTLSVDLQRKWKGQQQRREAQQ